MQYNQIEQIILNSNPLFDWGTTNFGLRTIKFFRDDVNLRIECSWDGDDIQNDDFKEKWANLHPNSKAVGYFVNIFYNASLIKRVILISIDGGNALLPLPDDKKKVKNFDYVVAQIFDTLSNLDSYLQRSGLTH